MKELVRAYQVEAQWFREGYVPIFDDSMRTSLIIGNCFLDPAAAFIGMGDVAGIDAYEWLRSEPKIMIASFTLGRLMVSSEVRLFIIFIQNNVLEL